jgi:hypothetical protein
MGSLFTKDGPSASELFLLIAFVFMMGVTKPSGVLPPDQTLKTVNSPDGKYKVSWIQHWTTNPPGYKVELYSSKLPNGPNVKLNLSIPHDDDVTLDGFVTKDSKRVCYRAGNTALGHFQLYSVPIQGPGVLSIKLNQTVAGQVFSGINEVSTNLVRYMADVTRAGGPVTEWFVKTNGGRQMQKVFVDGFNAGNSGAWR